MKKLLPILLLFVMTLYASTEPNKCKMLAPIDMLDGTMIFVPYGEIIANDLDCDGVLDKDDDDIDGDGVLNDVDAFPRDNTESKDSDGDGVGDNADRPIAKAQSITFDVNQSDASKEIRLTGEDNDVTTLDYSIVTQPSYGSLSGTLPNVVYQVKDGYVGTDSFSFKVNDGSLDSETVTVNIVLHDKLAPVITLNGESIINLARGSIYKELNATATDNVDGNVDVKITQSNSHTLNTNKIGRYRITYTARDKARNVSRVIRTVNVQVVERERPTIRLRGGTVTIPIKGRYIEKGAIAKDYRGNDITDNIVITKKTKKALNVNKVGRYNVRYDVKDSNGISAHHVYRTIVVVERPTIILNGGTVIVPLHGKYIEQYATAKDHNDNDITKNIVITRKTTKELNVNKIGNYLVRYDVRDRDGITAHRYRGVNVRKDREKPIITLTGEGDITIAVGSTYSDAGATANDNIDGDITSRIKVVNPVNTAVPRTYKVVYDVNDSSGNKAVRVRRTVHVVDKERPVITLNGESDITITVGSVYEDMGATARDNVDGDITSDILVVNPVNTAVPRTYKVVYDVNDSSGNKAVRVRRIVHVVEQGDTTPPILTLEPDPGTNDINYTIYQGDIYREYGATAMDDDETLLEVSIHSDTINTSETGSFDIVYTAIDAAGNEVSKTRRVTVVQKAPELNAFENYVLYTNEVAKIEFPNRGGVIDEEGCSIDPMQHSLLDGLSFNMNNCSITGTPTDKTDTNGYKVIAANSAGSSEIIFTIKVKDRPIELIDAPDITVTEGESVNILFENRGGPINTCGITFANGLDIDSTNCKLSGSPSRSGNLQVTATDSYGNEYNAHVNITVNPKKPDISDHDDVVMIAEGSDKVITFRNNSTAGDITDCSVQPGLPNSLSLDTSSTACTIIGSISSVQQNTLYTITAKNAGGEDSAKVYIKGVSQANGTAPSLVTPNDNLFKITAGSIIGISILNEGGNIDTCQARGLPDGLIIDKETCEISGKTTEEGNYPIKITAQNGVDKSEITKTLIVLAGNPNISAPVEANNNTITFPVGVYKEVLFPNSGGYIKDCSVTSKPIGLELNTTKDGCLLYGTAKNNFTKNTSFKVTAYAKDNTPSVVTLALASILITQELNGRVTFDLVPVSQTIGLDYNHTRIAPARGVKVVLFKQGETSPVEETVTDVDGNYTFSSATLGSKVKVKVYAQLKDSDTQNGSWEMNVTDEHDDMYVLEKSFTVLPDILGGADIHASSGWDKNQQSYARKREAAPFAILDVIYNAVQVIRTVDTSYNFPGLQIIWTKNSYDVTYYKRRELLADGRVNKPGKLYLMGEENYNTDEYDRHTIAHEFFHYVQDNFSRNDSLRGEHEVRYDYLDIRVAYAEGFATAFSLYVEKDNKAFATSGNKQSTTTIVNPMHFAGIDNGVHKELSVIRVILFLLHNPDIGFKNVFETFLEDKESESHVSLISFIDRLKKKTNLDATIDNLCMQYDDFKVIDQYTVEASKERIKNNEIAYKIDVDSIIGINFQFDYTEMNNSVTANGLAHMYYLHNKLGRHMLGYFEITDAGTYKITIKLADRSGNYKKYSDMKNPEEKKFLVKMKPRFRIFNKGKLIGRLPGEIDTTDGYYDVRLPNLDPGVYAVDISDAPLPFEISPTDPNLQNKLDDIYFKEEFLKKKNLFYNLKIKKVP